MQLAVIDVSFMFRLDKREFDIFKHPEKSVAVRQRFVDAFISTNDKDGNRVYIPCILPLDFRPRYCFDQIISLAEFLGDVLRGKTKDNDTWSAQAFNSRFAHSLHGTRFPIVAFR